jgi:ferredoxin-NADP reductase
MKFNSRICAGALFLPLLMLTTIGTTPVVAALQQAEAAAAKKPVVVEWVYRIQYGHQDEWWRIFKKYQIAILDRQKQLGYVKEYTVFAPSLHTSEDARWDYRVVIVRASEEAPPGQNRQTTLP